MEWIIGNKYQFRNGRKATLKRTGLSGNPYGKNYPLQFQLGNTAHNSRNAIDGSHFIGVEDGPMDVVGPWEGKE